MPTPKPQARKAKSPAKISKAQVELAARLIKANMKIQDFLEALPIEERRAVVLSLCGTYGIDIPKEIIEKHSLREN